MSNADASSLDLDLRILNHLEDEELAPLNWGLVDGGFSEEELEDLIDEFAKIEGDKRSVRVIKESLQAHALVLPIEVDGDELWRTRMAESVRLLVRLRQLFPKHLKSNTAASAATLVSDFRFVARRRRFPRRDVSGSEYVDAALARTAPSVPLRRALKGLAGDTLSYSGFQTRAAATILEQVDAEVPTVTLVASGTGSGKTKAFYLPALAKLATLVDGNSWAKMVAVYPRNELLKDQFLKTLRELRALRAATGVSLTLGAYYGDVPSTAQYVSSTWKERGGRSLCPFLACPKCEAEMFWRPVGQDRGDLQCTACNEVVGVDEVTLTRDQLQRRPPDVLLVTGEMLNRNLSNDWVRGVFGLGQPTAKRPRLLLLDEVHTLTGSLGAHTGLLLRRWRKALGSTVHTVALSATIEEGPRFLSQLLDVPVDRVTVVQPSDEELIDGGNEYLIALRSDPTSKAAVLSTSIQASMLLRRMLDLPDRPRSGGALGTKAFVFTDDLDVTNRMLHFLRSAEGQNDYGRPDLKRSPDGSLANLRHPVAHNDQYWARRDGQIWDLPLAIGHSLASNQTIKVERTSSQDPGLEKSADMVVATASLEVGLDDDSVGAVLQHKAPRDNAAFIQRRGRAGRQQRMRPWTAVVLSDYGRDRAAFQAWDQLFAPVLKAENLPVSNRHILRMQATFCLFDWIADRLRNSRAPVGNVWDDLKGPNTKPQRLRPLLDALDGLLDNPEQQSDFALFVRSSLGCDADEVERILWGAPRGVLSIAAPTLRRRLEAQWRSAVDPNAGDLQTSTPLPDFVPSALFNDLMLPEVEIELDPSVRLGNDRDSAPYMGVQQALREFAPGKVTHRFATGNKMERTWIDPGDGNVDISTYCTVEPLTVMEDEDGSLIKVLRPISLKPVSPKANIASTSSAFPRWLSRFDEVGTPTPLPVPDSSGWSRLILGIEAFMHEAGSHLRVTRATTGSDGTLKEGRTQSPIHTEFRFAGEPAALGFRLESDGIRLRLVDPGNWDAVLAADPVRAGSLRASWFRHLIETDDDLTACGSTFLSQWLAEVALALVVEQSGPGLNLQNGVDELVGRNLTTHLDRIMTVVFQSASVQDSGDPGDDELDISTLHAELRALATTDAAAAVLATAGQQLVQPSGPEFLDWLRDRYTATLAGAFINIAGELHDEIDVDDLVIDVLPWEDGATTMVVTETQPGGLGNITRLVGEIQEDPRRFWRMFEHIVGDSDDELLNRTLDGAVSATVNDAEVRDAFADVRQATSQSERRDAWGRAIAALERSGRPLGQSLRTAITLRMLRAGSSPKTDQLLHKLLQDWASLELSLGVEVDVRVFAYLASRDATLDQTLSVGAQGRQLTQQWRFSALLSLLWARGASLRSRYLAFRTPYGDVAEPDRTLLAERLLATGGQRRVLEGEKVALAGALAAFGEVELESRAGAQSLKEELLRRIVEPVELGVLEFYPRIVGVIEEGGRHIIRLEVPEVLG